MIRAIALLACLAWPALCFAADEYVFIVRARGNPYWRTLAEGIRETAAREGVSAIVYQGESEVSAEEQLSTCYTAIERKPRFLAVSAVSTGTGVLCLKRAQDAGIAVAELDSSVPVEEAERGGVRLGFSIGSDNRVIGRRAADFIAPFLSNPVVKIVVLEGAAGSEPGMLRVAGFREKLRELVPQAEIVASVAADWDRLKAMSIVLDLLQRTPDLTLIFAANDQMALGAVEALKTRGRLDAVKVIGVDGTAAAREAVKRGELTATVAQLPYLLGKRSVELAKQLAAGNRVPAREVLDTPVLTKQLLIAGSAPVLAYVR